MPIYASDLPHVRPPADGVPAAAHELLDGIDECACLKRPPAYAYCPTCRNALARAQQIIQAAKLPAVTENSDNG